ncbi:MAG: 50S ribosomal protein L6 [Rhodospirillales bacterium]|nr:50S ribosomal protein L6 [Rhodospirillales bacterium]
MSRVGKNPVKVPAGVTIEVAGKRVIAKGKLGELSSEFGDDVAIVREGDAVVVKPTSESLHARRMWGTVRANIRNMIEGVTTGYNRSLQINGVGFRAAIQGKDLVLQLGYSHEVRYLIPAGIKIACPEQTQIAISGSDRRLVGQVAANIRGFRPPEPYKGKGIKYAEETVRRKEGKKK